MQEDTELSVKKEREPKDDGRYIIYYTFEGGEEKEMPQEDDGE